ncbi:hypothetical protein Ancab_007623 [Ancistrocladus abbreviatus]
MQFKHGLNKNVPQGLWPCRETRGYLQINLMSCWGFEAAWVVFEAALSVAGHGAFSDQASATDAQQPGPHFSSTVSGWLIFVLILHTESVECTKDLYYWVMDVQLTAAGLVFCLGSLDVV